MTQQTGTYHLPPIGLSRGAFATGVAAAGAIDVVRAVTSPRPSPSPATPPTPSPLASPPGTRSRRVSCSGPAWPSLPSTAGACRRSPIGPLGARRRRELRRDRPERRGDRQSRVGAQRPRRRTGLEPAREYFYRFLVGGREPPRTDADRARPRRGERSLRFAFASCPLGARLFQRLPPHCRGNTTWSSTSATISMSGPGDAVRPQAPRARADDLDDYRAGTPSTRPIPISRPPTPRRPGWQPGTTMKSTMTTRD